MTEHRHIRVEFDDGSDPVELPHISHEIEKDFGRQSIGIFETYRDVLDEIHIEEGFDSAYVVVDGVDKFGGPIKQDINKGAMAEIIVESPERFGRDAKPVDPGEAWQNVDDAVIVRNAIDNVDEWSEGQIETVEQGVSFVFSHSSQAKKIRKVEGSTSGELKFHGDGTVDYLDMIGSDKTTTTLSPANQNVVGDIEVSREGAEGRVTHLRLVGSGEGPHQVTATVVSNDWDEGDTEKWDTYRDKGIGDADTLEKVGETLMQELNSVTLEADLAIKGPDVQLGDKFHVEKPEENLDHNLRVVSLTTIVDSDGRKHSCVLSNKWDSREDPETKRREDIENYNVAVEGTAVPINATGGRQPVESGIDYEMRFYYPAEVAYEHRLNVRVIGLPYRAYSKGAASSGGRHSHSVDIPSHSHSFSISDHSHDVTYTVPFHVHSLNTDEPTTSFDGSHNHDGAVGSDGGHNHDYERAYGMGGPSDNDSDTTTSDSGGGTSSTTSSGGSTTETSSSTTPSHTHDPQPGVIEFDEYPSACDVLVNGQSVGTSFGDGAGPFQEAVDVIGQLNPGEINTIKVTSDTLGHLAVYVEGDIYRQILGSG